MKKILMLALLTILLSCKKNDTAQKIALNGTWEYRGITCFCIRDSSMNDGKPGNGSIINFNNDSYKRFIKGVLQKGGTYQIVQEKSGNTNNLVNRIIYDNDTASEKTFYKIEQNKLTFFGTTPIAADGTEIYYEKQ
ncbi:hypothetical protein [Mucilaginibacter sp. OK098]|uniref:hypothetical protein n=1 Tax=Mucilaginibacter sp. OK098 TaxID=1855297 RepID=UPI0011612965|nr:hypothetical protein [Mucilaginibacter sp. OK098]